jgi:replicative DNA helicase
VNYATPDYQPYIALAQEIMRRAYAEEDATELNRWLASQVAGISGVAQDSNAVLTWEESFIYTAQMLEKFERDAMLPPEQRTALNWPWDAWNDMIDAFEPGMLFTLFAGDGMGKTIVAECCGEYWARKKKRVVFLHYELNKTLMMLRRLARHTGLTVKELKGIKTPAQRQVLAKAEPLLRSWDGMVTYVHCPGWSMAQTVQKLSALKAEGLCDVVITDYIEKVGVDRRQMQLFNGLYQREADNVEQLKNFAESTETPVLMLAQGSKEGKSKKNVEDMDRGDMRGAGEKSERANIVVKLHRERVPDGEWENGEQIIKPNGYSRHTTILVDKQTLGATGSFPQFMEPHFFRMHDVTRQELNQ